MSDLKQSDSESAPPLGPISSSPTLKAYQIATRERAGQAKGDILCGLRQLGAVRLEIDYDGCGDSGQVEGITLWNAKDEVLASDTVTHMNEALETFVYDLLEIRQPGWENNDGGHGQLQWDIREDRLTHTHNERYTDYDTTEYEGL